MNPPPVTTEFTDKYEIKGEIGKGATCIVKLCVEKATGLQYAAKIINTTKFRNIEYEKVLREARICRKLQHPNIIQLYDSIKEPGYHYFVLDFFVDGDLFDDIATRESYSEVDASHCIQQVLEALKYCHEQNIVHRDLKPENLLLASKGKGAIVKLSDFGAAMDLDEEDGTNLGLVGTPNYIAPEVLKKEKYGKPVDIWSCGVVLYILLFGYPPFYDPNTELLYSQIKAGECKTPFSGWDSIKAEANDILKKMMNTDQYTRTTATAALTHPWICQREHTASKLHRSSTIDEIKSFNARRRLKGAIYSTILASKLASKCANLLTPDEYNVGASTSSGGISTADVTTRVPKRLVSQQAVGTEAVDISSPSKRPKPEITPPVEHAQVDRSSVPDTNSSEDARIREIIMLTAKLIASIRDNDYKTYALLCDPSLTAFEPHTSGLLVKGTTDNTFLIERELGGSCKVINTTFHSPCVHLLGSHAACIAYKRLTQYTDNESHPHTYQAEETRIWLKKGEIWKNVHRHNSSHGRRQTESIVDETPIHC